VRVNPINLLNFNDLRAFVRLAIFR
jgi:hypothetical protein